MVSIKYTDMKISPEYEFIQEVMQTVKNTMLCKHPNILPYFITFQETERIWSVTVPVLGTCRLLLNHHFQGFDVFIKEGFNEAAVSTIIKEILKAVLYLHDNHMIHNDIKADNIVIGSKGEPRLVGLRQMSHLSKDGGYMKSVLSPIGDNVQWAAPEVMAQNINYNEKADIYSVGITTIELALNKTPFDSWEPLKVCYESQCQVLLCKQQYECPAVKTDKHLSKYFYRFIKDCLQKNPDDRYKMLKIN